MAPLFLILLFLSGADSVRTVSRLTALAGGSVTIPCHYDQKYNGHVKYWCQGYAWLHCKTIVRTDSPQREGEVSITDDPAQQVFTVTLNNLQVKDSDYYWCAVEIDGKRDDRMYLNLRVTEGAPDLSVVGNMTVVNGIGGSISIFCRYDNSVRDTEKRWCRIGDQISCLTAGRSGTSQDRISLNINNTQRLLTVTVRELQRSDTGWYWCSAGDLQTPVHINVTNGTSTVNSKTPSWGRTVDVLLKAAVCLLFLICTIIAVMVMREK